MHDNVTKRNLLIALVMFGCLIPILDILGGTGVIQNGILLSSLIKVLLVCIFVVAGIYFFKFKNCSYPMLAAIVAAFACAFALVVKWRAFFSVMSRQHNPDFPGLSMPKNERPCIRNAITSSRLHYGCRVLPFAPEATKTWCKKVRKRIDCVGNAPSPPGEFPRNRRGLGARKSGNALIASVMHQVPQKNCLGSDQDLVQESLKTHWLRR